MPPITDTEFRERVRKAVLDVLAELPDTTYNEDPFSGLVGLGYLMSRVDYRYRLEVRDVLDGLVSGGQVMRTTTSSRATTAGGELFSLTPWHRWADVVEAAREHGGWLSILDFTETLDSRPQDGLLTALDALHGWGVLEVKRGTRDYLYRYCDPVEHEDVHSPTPADERRHVRRFLYDAYQRALAEYREVGGMNDPWDLVDRLEAEGYNRDGVARLLLAEFLDGKMDDQNAVRFSVSTVPPTPVASRE